MKKKEKSNNVIVRFFKGIYRFLDKIIITPISKAAYFIKDKLTFKSGIIDKILNKPNVLLYVSLFIALLFFFAVDKKVIGINDTKALVLKNQPVNVEYNEEAYVIEGLPDTVDIILMGRSGDLYLAEQRGDHEVSLDLTNLDVGTHKVQLEYNKPINTLNYKLDPSSVTVVIYPKVSETRSVSIDLINTDKLNETLVVSNVLLDKNDVIIKSYKEKLEKVANVKAIVDVNNLNAKESGTYTLDGVKLIAYDEEGKEMKDIEIVPETVTATITITSPSKTVPLKVVPKGEVRSGSAIGSITSSVTNITVYGDESILADLNYIEVEIDVTNLSENKVYQKVINKPAGTRSISDTSVTITVTMEEETSRDFTEISVEVENLDPKFNAKADTHDDAYVIVTVKGVKSLLDNLETSNIKAYVDLKDITEPGTYSVPVYVTGTDLKLTYTSKIKSVNIIITNK